MFPQTFIWFGILHFAWVATLLALPLRRLGWSLLPLAGVVAWAGNGPASVLFDSHWLGWIGFMTHKPWTEDYVPLFPWFAAVLVGLSLGPWLGRPRQPVARLAHAQRPEPLAGWPRGERALRWLGRHTLAVYLLHQPLLIGALELARAAGLI